MNSEYEIVATGNVWQGDWMRRYIAEAEGVKYRSLTREEAMEVRRQIEEGE